MHRLDLYGECNVNQAPMDVFSSECCARCVNPDCTRSTFGTSRFEKRVNSWHERLFTEVPRMSRDDERYGKIAAQQFQFINPALTVCSGWSEEVPVTEPAPVVVPVAPVAETPPIAAPMEPALVSEEKPAVPPSSSRQRPTNTPLVHGQMVQPPGVRTNPSSPAIVPPGARIKLGP